MYHERTFIIKLRNHYIYIYTYIICTCIALRGMLTSVLQESQGLTTYMLLHADFQADVFAH